MPPARRSLVSRVSQAVADFFAIDDDWERPSPPIGPFDWFMGLLLGALGMLTLAANRSLTDIDLGTAPGWFPYVAVVVGGLLVVWRRRYPLSVAGLAATHMFIAGVTMPAVLSLFVMQAVYFSANYSAVAWARHRRSAMLVAGGIAIFMLLWVVWQIAFSAGMKELLEEAASSGSDGPLGTVAAAAIVSLVINVAYFGGAIIIGQTAWRSARRQARILEQSETIAAQSNSLQRRAVIDERLRIARELHDVVGHHIAVIGIQAGAAGKVLDVRPQDARQALSQIEQSSRDAVSQMRGLLGTLREIEETSQGGRSERGREPEPELTELPTLIEHHRAQGLDAAYRLVESTEGAHRSVVSAISVSLYRVAQEALANIARHSTATRADVALRIEVDGPSRHAEVEIIDNGRPRHGTSGTGLGQLGIRERVASHHGTVEIGPRVAGGYRVRVRIPLGENDV